MLKLSDTQLHLLADALLHESHPKTEPFEKQPLYIRVEWVTRALEAVDNYNLVMKLIDSGVIQST